LTASGVTAAPTTVSAPAITSTASLTTPVSSARAQVSKPATHSTQKLAGHRAQSRSRSRTLLDSGLTVQQQLPFDDVLTDSCFFGEPVELFGTVHSEVHISFGSNGSFHFNSTTDAYGLKGLGMISGAQYTSNDLSVVDANLGPSQTADFVDRFILNAQGPVDNVYAYDHIKFTVNANGVATVTFLTPKVSCNG
jgi:hypothetical protein